MSTGGNTYQFTITASNGVPPPALQSFSLLINRPPVAGANTLGTTRNTSAVALASKMLLAASDPDGDSLTVSGVSPTSTQGGSVNLSGNSVTYVPPTDYVGSDTFSYTISDGRGGFATGSVQVTVAPSNAPSLNIVSLTVAGNGVNLVAQGIRGFNYRVQSTDSLAQPFTDLSGILTADSSGRLVYFDGRTPAALPPNRFYRVVSVP